MIPEAAAMVSAQVIGNDATITVAGQAGNFELNVMLPPLDVLGRTRATLTEPASTSLSERSG